MPPISIQTALSVGDPVKNFETSEVNEWVPLMPVMMSTMPPTSEPSRSQPRRKSKPKFEIPAEAGLPPAAGWVYRASDVPARDVSVQNVLSVHVGAKVVPAKPAQVKPVPVTPRAAVHKEPVAPAAVSPAPETEPLWAAGFDLVALGFTTMQKTATGTFHVLSAPIRRARRLLI